MLHLGFCSRFEAVMSGIVKSCKSWNKTIKIQIFFFFFISQKLLKKKKKKKKKRDTCALDTNDASTARASRPLQPNKPDTRIASSGDKPNLHISFAAPQCSTLTYALNAILLPLVIHCFDGRACQLNHSRKFTNYGHHFANLLYRDPADQQKSRIIPFENNLAQETHESSYFSRSGLKIMANNTRRCCFDAEDPLFESACK